MTAAAWFGLYGGLPCHYPVPDTYPVMRIPVAGPDPYNTLVIVRGLVDVLGEYGPSNGRIGSWRLRLWTPFKLIGFDPRVPPPVTHSTSAALQMMQHTDSMEDAMIVSNFAVDFEHPYEHSWRSVDYRLQITNLHDHPINFMVEAHVNVDAYASDVDARASREIPTVHRLAAGGLMSAMAVPVGRHGDAVGWLIRVAAGSSGLFHLVKMPQFDPGPLLDYVTLRVPPARDRNHPTGVRPQSPSPVSVLLSA